MIWVPWAVWKPIRVFVGQKKIGVTVRTNLAVLCPKTDLTPRWDRASSERDLGVILCLNSVWILNDVQLVHMLNTMVNSSWLNPECTWVCSLNGWHTTIECNWLTSYSYVEFNSEFKLYTLFICVPICTICAYMLTMMVSSSVCSTCMLCISRWYVFDSRC